eukprot:gene10131-2550_t
MKSVSVELPLSRENEDETYFTFITKNFPLPPNFKKDISSTILDDEKDELLEEQIEYEIGTLISRSTSEEIDKEKWLSVAMKRNPHLLYLTERLRPFSNQSSFSIDILKKKKVSSTENPDVLTRENLIQIIHQHFRKQNQIESSEQLAEETGVKFNGIYNDETDQSVLKTLLSIGINAPEKIKQMPKTKKKALLKDDIEVQTASIYTHLDRDFDPCDLRNNVWLEILNNEEDNIWAPFDQKQNRIDVKAMTLSKMIDLLTLEEEFEPRFLDTFLMTYRSFTTPEVLLKKLIEKYDVPAQIPNEKIIQSKIGNILKTWLTRFFFLDWNQNMLFTLNNFIDSKLSSIENMDIAMKIQKTVQTKLEGDNEDETIIQYNQKRTYPTVPKNLFNNDLKLEEIDEMELARQITLMEQEYYLKIKPVELLDQAWNNEKLKHRAVNISKLTRYFNQISAWVANMITLPESLRVRKSLYIKAVNITRNLFKINNLNSCLALNAALQNAGVHRLKFTKEGVDANAEKDIKNIEYILTDTRDNQKAYKTHLNEIKLQRLPTMPYIGIWLTELIFINDGNPNMVEHGESKRKLINWKKRKLEFETISKVKEFQIYRYDFFPVYQIRKVIEKKLEETFLQDDDLYNISKEREPRNAKKDALIA